MEQKIIELTKLGMSVRYISELLGCTGYHVRRVRKENGLTKNPDAPLDEVYLKHYPPELLEEWDSVTEKFRRWKSE